jgi:predicted HicB family RNase H-like nuclease
MSGLRKDKTPAQKDRFSVLASVELITALSRMADKKGVSRNALIAQLLTKAAKKYIEEVQG